MKRVATILILLAVVPFATSCGKKQSSYYWKSMEVTVSAYNSVSWQTDSLHNLAAWGDTLKPGMKTVAVSADLLEKGLTYNTPVKIEGLKGVYLVKDKMHPRWRNKIDVYMGKDVKRAREWGRKKLSIRFPALRDTLIQVSD